MKNTTEKSAFEGNGGTVLVFPGPDPEQYPRSNDKETWDRPEKLVIREDEWVHYVMTWDKKRNVAYSQGFRRPRWAIGWLYRWWYRRTIIRSLTRKEHLDD